MQELAFTLADGFHYVETCLARGLDVDDFAPRLSFFFNAHNDMFEEIAKYRAARVAVGRGAAQQLRRHARRASWKLRFHAQTAGCSLQDKQPRSEPDPRRLSGAGGGAGRLPVAAHQQHGRDAGPAVANMPSRWPCARSRCWPTKPA